MRQFSQEVKRPSFDPSVFQPDYYDFKPKKTLFWVIGMLAPLCVSYSILTFSHTIHYSLLATDSLFLMGNSFCTSIYMPNLFYFDYVSAGFGSLLGTFLFKFIGASYTFFFVAVTSLINIMFMDSAFQFDNCQTLLVSLFISSINQSIIRCISLYFLLIIVHRSHFTQILGSLMVLSR